MTKLFPVLDRKAITGKHAGFTLIEVIIFTMLISLIFTTLAYSMASTLRDGKVNEHRILATRYAQELEEWLSSEKETDWVTFTSHGSPGGLVHCFNHTTLDWATDTCNANEYLDTIYQRQVTLTNTLDVNTNKVTQVNVHITVTFVDGSRTFTIPVDTVFSLWE